MEGAAVEQDFDKYSDLKIEEEFDKYLTGLVMLLEEGRPPYALKDTHIREEIPMFPGSII
jgi:hypothetical protein